jgi:hypothetical protein
MIKVFLTYTSIIEALTGIALIAFPTRVVLLLFESPLNGTGGIILTMIAGAAIFSLALGCWLLRESAAAPTMVKVLLCYNFVLTAIVLYGACCYKLKGPGLWLIAWFHFIQIPKSIKLIQKKQGANNSR